MNTVLSREALEKISPSNKESVQLQKQRTDSYMNRYSKDTWDEESNCFTRTGISWTWDPKNNCFDVPLSYRGKNLADFIKHVNKDMPNFNGNTEHLYWCMLRSVKAQQSTSYRQVNHPRIYCLNSDKGTYCSAERVQYKFSTSKNGKPKHIKNKHVVPKIINPRFLLAKDSKTDTSSYSGFKLTPPHASNSKPWGLGWSRWISPSTGSMAWTSYLKNYPERPAPLDQSWIRLLCVSIPLTLAAGLLVKDTLDTGYYIQIPAELIVNRGFAAVHTLLECTNENLVYLDRLTYELDRYFNDPYVGVYVHKFDERVYSLALELYYIELNYAKYIVGAPTYSGGFMLDWEDVKAMYCFDTHFFLQSDKQVSGYSYGRYVAQPCFIDKTITLHPCTSVLNSVQPDSWTYAPKLNTFTLPTYEIELDCRNDANQSIILWFSTDSAIGYLNDVSSPWSWNMHIQGDLRVQLESNYNSSIRLPTAQL